METCITLTIDQLNIERSFPVEDITVVCSRITPGRRSTLLVKHETLPDLEESRINISLSGANQRTGDKPGSPRE